MSNSVPSGWGVKNLIDCSVNGISNGVFRDPKTVGEGYKLINVFEMYQGFGVDVNLTERLPLSDKEFQKNKVNYGDVFFTRSSLKLEGIAYCNINLSHDDDITYEGHLMRVVPDRNFVEPEYLARFCLSDEARIFFMSSAKHSSMTTISQSDIAPLKVLLPPLPEQQKIAAILTSVDDVIESTQAQINKLKDLKTGMMQELLTKGIGHSEFKDSPVGRIPKAWDCVLLDKVARRGSGHTPDKQTKEYWNGGIKWVSLADSSKLDKLHISETENEISSDGIKNSSAVLHPKGTVVLSRDAGIGKSAVTTDAMAVSQHFMAWICGEKLNNYFLYYLLQMWKPRFENIAMGSTIKTIGLQYFKTLEIPLPEISEQIKIAESFLSLDDSIFKAERKRNHLTNIKKALMQDLLTGKVRVKVS